MKKLQLSYLLGVAAICSFFISCSSSNQVGEMVDLIPVQMEEDGKWSMVDKDGKLKYEDEFKEAPTCVVNGVFSIKEGDGITLYKADAKPTPIKNGEGLKAAGYLQDGLIPIVRENSRITLIDENGKDQFTLGPINGKEIVSCAGGYSDGLLRIKVEGGEYGYVDTKGKLIGKAEYFEASDFEDGYALVLKDETHSVINKKGETVLKLKKDWQPLASFHYGAVVVRDANDRILFVNEKGDTEKCPSKVHGIEDYNKNYYIFYDGESYGVMRRKDNEVMVRAKYNDITFGNDDNFLCIDNKGSYILNSKGEVEKSLDEYIRLQSFGNFGILAREKKEWLLLDAKGTPKKGCEFKHISLDLFYGSSIDSEYFDVEALAQTMVEHLTTTGYGKVKLGDTPQSFLSNPREYAGETTAIIDSLKGYRVEYVNIANFSGPIAKYNYDYYSYDGSYTWNNVKVEGIFIGAHTDNHLDSSAVKALVGAMEKKGFKEFASKYKGGLGIAVVTSKESAAIVTIAPEENILYIVVKDLPTPDELKDIKEKVEKYEGEMINSNEESTDYDTDSIVVIEASESADSIYW